jgi:hypothetical protein
MYFPPYQQRVQIRTISQPSYPDYLSSTTGTAKMQRWFPLYRLLQARFRGGKGFSDYEVGRLIGLRQEYESGVGRKG